MKAIAIDQFGSIDVFSEREIPIPKPSRHEVRIKVAAVGFNPVDYKIRKGAFGKGNFPLILGAECSGYIDAVGDSHSKFSVGDQVYAFVFGRTSNGSYAEYLCLPSQFVSKIPKALSLEEAAGVPVNYLTAFQALIGTGAFQQRRPLFIAGGGGGVSSAAIALTRVYKGGPVFTTAGSKQSKKYLDERFDLQEDQILDYQNLTLNEMEEKCLRMNHGKAFYFTLDCVGKEMKKLCISLAAVNGHIATIVPEEEGFLSSPFGRESLLIQKSLSLHTVMLPSSALHGKEEEWNVYQTRLDHLASLFQDEGLIKPHITKVGNFSVETVQRAHTTLEEGHTKGKLIMTLSGSI